MSGVKVGILQQRLKIWIGLRSPQTEACPWVISDAAAPAIRAAGVNGLGTGPSPAAVCLKHGEAVCL
jgi:hypothetical protein